MMLLPTPIQNMITAFARLPGIGPKTASRLTFFLLRASDDLVEEMAASLGALKKSTTYCQVCYNITEVGREECEVCASEDRDSSLLCVVEDPLDVLALERTEGFPGKYHVLHGTLSPIEGIGPEDIKIRELIARIDQGGIAEVILATNPSMEGDATAMYIQQQLQAKGVQVTRLARGLPVGGDLEYADQSTLLRALAGRQMMK
jgi:recombination protein RecR